MNTKEIHFITIYHEIHRLRYVEHFSIQHIANHLSINFRAVKNYLDMSPEDFEQYLDSIKRRSSLLDTYREFISGSLEQERRRTGQRGSRPSERALPHVSGGGS